MDFEISLHKWIESGFSQIPKDQELALSYNLYNHILVDSKFGVELIGAPKFDPNDPDWPCDEIWWPQPRGLKVPLDWSGDQWMGLQIKVAKEIKRSLKVSALNSTRFANVVAVAVGFVDGDLEVIWTKSQGMNQ